MDEPNISTLVVCVLSIFLICIPFALRGGGGIEGSSVLFISLPPAMNQTMANEALIKGIKPGVLVFEYENRFWAHVICAAAGVEALILWVKVGTMSDSKSFTYTKVLNIGGLYTANTEFCFFVGMHHVVFIMLLLSPISFHALFLFVWVIVGILSKICEPSDDHEEDSLHGEVYCNRVVYTVFFALVLGMLSVVDARMNRANLAYIPGVQVNLLFTQLFIDACLAIVHASIQVDIATCYYARLMYTFVCGGLVVCFLACA